MTNKINIIYRRDDISLNLRNYIFFVYKYISVALLLTGVTSILAATTQRFMYLIHYTNFKWFIACVPLGMAFFIGNKLIILSCNKAYTCFVVFSILMGLSLSSIFIIFTSESIARVFFITSATFAAMSTYGCYTGRDLSSVGSFLLMGAVGLLISSMINVFFKSSAIYFVSSLAAVIIFSIFTAYDMQRIKALYYCNTSNTIILRKLAIYGSLTLYMDFINLFVGVLQLFGVRRSD